MLEPTIEKRLLFPPGPENAEILGCVKKKSAFV
jgi:hypothetical protein